MARAVKPAAPLTTPITIEAGSMPVKRVQPYQTFYSSNYIPFPGRRDAPLGGWKISVVLGYECSKNDHGD
jgi:hypothetical protein